MTSEDHQLLAIMWTLPTAFPGGATAAACIGAIHSLANLGGFVRPYLIGWIRDTYHRIPANLRGSVPLIVALLVSALRYRMH